MPQNSFELINHAYSFSYSVTHSGGETYSLPQSDYGVYGQHVDAFFETIPGTGQGGVSHLKAWFLSDLGLTWSLQAGATTQIYNYMEQRFPIDSNTTGRGLIDLRSSPDWKHVIGDGIIAPTTLAGTGSTHAYTEGIKRIYDTMKGAYPNMEWAIAGLPHIPYFMTFAPAIGLSAQMSAGGHEPIFGFNNADPNHPTGYYDVFYTWTNCPASLSDYYTELTQSGMQRTILDECDTDWLCYDVRVPHQKNFPFYRDAYLPVDSHNRNNKLARIAADYAQYYNIKSFAEISTVYPSRYNTEYDDPESYFLGQVTEEGNLESDYDPYSLSGASSNASNSYYPVNVLQYEMIQPAAEGGCYGFLFSDPVPAMIEMACTASTAGLGDTGDSQSLINDARTRARNMFSYILFGGSDWNGYEPDGGWTAGWVYNELRRFASNETVGILDRIREAVRVGDRGTILSAAVAGQNGWKRTIPSNKQTTPLPQESTNKTESDDVYGQQNWPALLGAIECCPPGCDPDNPDWSSEECCPTPETDPNCDCGINPFAYGCCDPDSGTFDPENCCVEGGPIDPLSEECGYGCIPGSPTFSISRCCGTIIPWGNEACPCGCRECDCVFCPGGQQSGQIGTICGWLCIYDNDSGSENCSSFGGGQYDNCVDACEAGVGAGSEADCQIGQGEGCSGILPLTTVRETQYDKLLDSSNIMRIKRDRFILSRKNTESVRDWVTTAYTSQYSLDDIQTTRNTANVTVNDPSVSLDALKLLAEKDISRHQNFGNFSP
jgi:hypothetical protein